MDLLAAPPRTLLLVEGRPVAVATVASSRRERAKGLLGCDRALGALWLQGASSVHTVGMRFAIDVARLDREGVVVELRRLVPDRLLLPRRGIQVVVEADAGAMADWGITVGRRVALG